jgi:hypothetical protein
MKTGEDVGEGDGKSTRRSDRLSGKPRISTAGNKWKHTEHQAVKDFKDATVKKEMVSFNAKTVKLLDDKDGLGADIQIRIGKFYCIVHGHTSMEDARRSWQYDGIDGLGTIETVASKLHNIWLH